ncbi:EscC/YscC/HrcC family type III secretion system outer membrane ring protein [Salmonella enterica]|nr:EscC/YscC/HrcC family type III secretion system outer membrane ring protein [Salmonella enterica]
MKLKKLSIYVLLFIESTATIANCYATVFTKTSLQEIKNNDSFIEGNLKKESESVYVAHNNSVQQIFHVLGGLLHKPVIVSTLAAQKRITGDFDTTNPWRDISELSNKLGLIWYYDGTSVYIYDDDELKNKVIKLSYAPFTRLLSYLKSTSLYDSRFPLRSGMNAGSFYVSGPPVYVDLVAAAAKFIDSTYSRPDSGAVTVRVINLKNTFVNDRNYSQRGTSIIIPGVATVLNQLLTEKKYNGYSIKGYRSQNQYANENAFMAKNSVQPSFPTNIEAFTADSVSGLSGNTETTVPLSIIAYSDTNSLLVQGTERQVEFVTDIVNAIDVPKKQIQLSLWIIDVSKDDVNELGVQWHGSTTLGNTGVTLNTSTLAPDSSFRFLADVTALAKKGNAQVVSRPEVLTKENIPALFDNNSSFYSKLIGDHAVSLQTITYGTMISVLPRMAQGDKDIDMILNIQDGGIPTDVKGNSVYVDNLPEVNNTQISTEAQVPVGFSLLVGGYSRIQDDYHNLGIPLLKDIPLLGKLFDYSYSNHKNMVRLFLIQPKVLAEGEVWHNSYDSFSVVGKSSDEKDITLRATVSMLRQYINHHM